MSDWIDTEFGTLDLGDARLNARARLLLDRLAARPTAHLPAACHGHAEAVAAYRFFDNPKADPDAIRKAHRDATAARCRRHPVVLVVGDTTEFDFTRPRRKLEGGGPLNYEDRVGFLHHAQIAVTPERLCLGAVAAHAWARDPADPNKNDRRKRVPFEQKESHRWWRGHLNACELAAELPGTQVVSVTDREGDIYECFLPPPEGTAGRANWVTRCCQTSRTLEGGGSIYQAVAASPAGGHIEVEVAAGPARKARRVRLAVQWASAELDPPYRPGAKLPRAAVNVVRVCDVEPVEGEERIEWVLLTDLPTDDFGQACRVVDSYACRPQVEVYFRVLKSGCTVEQLQLESFDRVRRCLALYEVVAWRVMYAAMLARECPEMPCDTVFTADEWQSVWSVVRRESVPAEPPGMREFVRMVASLGGFLCRKGDGEPGPQTLWVGLQRMRDFALAWAAFGPGRDSKPVPAGRCV